MYLNIQTKEDSAEKLAAVAGQPTKNYLFAPEFNTVVNSINTLRHLITLNSGNIDILLSIAPKVELGTIAVSYIDVINNSPAVVLPSPVFVTYTIGGVFYVKAFVGDANTYGTTSGLTVNENNFLPVYQSDEDNEVSSQDNIPKKATYTFAELGLDPGTVTHEEIIAAVKVANAGDVVGDVDLRYIEIVEVVPVSYNFDVTANWNLTKDFDGETVVPVVDVDSFLYWLSMGANIETFVNDLSDAVVTDFSLIDGRLRCNLSSSSGTQIVLDNLEISEINSIGDIPNLEYLYLNTNNITSVDFLNNHTNLQQIYLYGNALSSVPAFQSLSSLLSLNLANNELTSLSYTEAETMASEIVEFPSTCNISFTGNTDSVSGTTLQTILISKNCNVIT